VLGSPIVLSRVRLHALPSRCVCHISTLSHLVPDPRNRYFKAFEHMTSRYRGITSANTDELRERFVMPAVRWRRKDVPPGAEPNVRATSKVATREACSGYAGLLSHLGHVLHKPWSLAIRVTQPLIAPDHMRAWKEAGYVSLVISQRPPRQPDHRRTAAFHLSSSDKDRSGYVQILQLQCQ